VLQQYDNIYTKQNIMKKDIIPDALNSRNESVILELPNYSYCHSSQTQTENHSSFLGRHSLLKKLIDLLSSSTNKTGVYLVTGNRGVGKSRLVEKVIEETSLTKNNIINHITFLFLALFLTLGLQYITNQNWHLDDVWGKLPTLILITEIISFIILFFVLGHKSYVRRTAKDYDEDIDLYFFKGKLNCNALVRTLKAAAIDFFLLPNKANPFLRTRNVLKLILILFLIQTLATIIPFTHFQVFLIYLCVTIAYNYIKYARRILIEEYRRSFNDKLKEWKYLDKKTSLALAFSKSKEFRWSAGILITTLFIAILTVKWHWWILPIGILLVFGILFLKHLCIIRKTLSNKDKAFKLTLKYSYPQITAISKQIDHYIKNSSRVYLKINFGHDILNEQDILRLITRILTTEYKHFRQSWLHTFYWRALALVIIFSATYLFYLNIYEKDIQPFIETKIESIDKSVGSQEFFSVNKYHIHYKDTAYIKQYLKSEYKNESIVCQIDKAINRIYCFIRNSPKYFWTKNITDELKYNYARNPINYAFVSIFFVFYLLGCGLLRLRCFSTHYTIHRKLKHLNENITYSVEREFSVGVGNSNDVKANYGFTKKQKRLIADAREIEKELQDILNAIQKIPVFMARPEFVIVFDELDKVTPETQIPTPAQETETKRKENLFASNSTRERQAIILKLLSNLKYFLSTANAKFVFIAGREMYDMYLADIADRNNYFGSIFNDVIFVPSFLTDCNRTNKKQDDITALVEEYVCRHLIPNDYPNLEYNLKEYVKYLDDRIYKEAVCVDIEEEQTKKEKMLKNETSDSIKKDILEIDSRIENFKQAERKKQKIIASLQQFIIYLAHTSKGAPKKIVQVFESFIENYKEERIAGKYLVVKYFKRTTLYLNFDYYDQYTIGMTSYLMSPVFNRLSDSNIAEHSDKLLVSTLHFVDYMMKFHNHNFSWRNIDISPEVIEINHSPELNAVVNDIVTLFEQIHFHKPIISLFEFKFDALLAQEIFFLSKMDERFSAQFNFSLDESLMLKTYYKSLLKEKQTEYKEFKDVYGNDNFSSIASLQIVLADLHFLDDELDTAALYYKDALFLIRKQLNKDEKEKKDDLKTFYLFLCNQLKLAYLYEKRKQPDFAYLLYGELTTLLINYRDFDLEEYGVCVRKCDDEYVLTKKQANSLDYEKQIEIPPFIKDKDTFLYEEKADYFSVSEYEQNSKWQENKKKSSVRSMQFQQLSPITQKIIFKNMTFEGLQMLYLPILAKLQILEKRYLVGILKKDIDLTIKEFEFLTRTIKHSEVKILAADFYSKIGDILFYKNKVFNSSSDKAVKTENNNQKIDISHYPCLYYKKAFIALAVQTSYAEYEQKLFEKETIINILKYKGENNQSKAKYIESKTGTRYRSLLARTFSNLGDSYFQAIDTQCLSCELKDYESSWNDAKNSDFWGNLWKFIDNPQSNYYLDEFLKDFVKDDGIKQHLNKIELAFFFYALSMKFYRKANQHKHSAFQISKMLNCIKYCWRNNLQTEGICLFLGTNYENLKNLANRAIRFLHIAYDNLNTVEINKSKEDFDKFKELFNTRDIPLQYIQVDSEISRIRTIVKEIELELKLNKNNVEIVKKLYAQFITSPYHSNYSVSARVHRLRVKDRLNREFYNIIKDSFSPNCNFSCENSLTDDCRCEKFSSNVYFSMLCMLTQKSFEKKNNHSCWENKEIAWEDCSFNTIIQNFNISKCINKFFAVLEMLISDSIFCLDEILRLIKTAGDSYLFNHSFFASIYDRLAIWTARFEVLQNIKDFYCNETEPTNQRNIPKQMNLAIEYFPYSNYHKTIKEVFETSQIHNYLRKQIGIDFQEKLSSHYFREQALTHYFQMKDIHNSGRSYMNLLEQMYFIKGDYDDITSHYNVALERFLINNTEVFDVRRKELEDKGKQSTIYNIENYFEKTGGNISDT
jgi:hypothetical protein